MDFFAADATIPELPPDSWRENVAAVVMDAAGHVLLGLGCGRNAYWHFPQGGISSRETAEDALRRELWEEVRLAPGSYRILCSYGGLRYRYRKNNDKSGRWRGQEQCYFLVLCHAVMPATSCSHTDEFCALTWVPWRELASDLFAPFKRKVVDKVLAHFFPPHLTAAEHLEYLREALTPRRYCLSGRALKDCPVEERALFAGGKEEMANTLPRLGLRLRAAQKAAAASGSRLLVLLHGCEGSGRRQCLRRLAAQLDPLGLRVAEADLFTPGLPWELLQALPPAGGLSFVMHRAASGSAATSWQLCEQWLLGQGIRLLKLYLHTDTASEDASLLTVTDSAAAPWYVIPAERRWYRDYVVASLVSGAWEASAVAPPGCEGAGADS